MFVCAVNRELTPVRSRYDSCASSARSSCLSTASSTHSVRSSSPQRRRHTTTVGRYHPSSSVTASPYEYDMTATSSESVERSSRTSAPRHAGMMTSLADSVASDGEVSSCRFDSRGSVSRFLAARRRESIDSGLTLDSATFQTDFRRASDPLLNNCGVVENPGTTQRCHSSASAPGTAAVWPGHRAGGSVTGAGSRRGVAPSLMSSRSSIATNMSDDVDIKYTPPTSAPSVADQVVGDLIIPDEMRDFINETYANQPVSQAVSQTVSQAVSLNADSTVADSPAAPVDSTSGLDEPVGIPADIKPTPLASCMFEGQPGGNSVQRPGNSTQLAGAVGDVHSAASAGGPFDVPTTMVSPTPRYFRSPAVPQAYQNNHEVQVSQVSQSWRAESANCPLRSYGNSVYHQRMMELTAEDLAVRHRRNPHQMNWWSRTYGYQHAGNYRPNYALPPPSVHPPRTAASFIPSQTSPSCNQVLCHIHYDCGLVVRPHVFINTYCPICSLHSQAHHLLAKPSVGRCAFSYAVAQIWNHIPTAIRVVTSLDSFKRHLKTHYFASP